MALGLWDWKKEVFVAVVFFLITNVIQTHEENFEKIKKNIFMYNLTARENPLLKYSYISHVQHSNYNHSRYTILYSVYFFLLVFDDEHYHLQTLQIHVNYGTGVLASIEPG